MKDDANLPVTQLKSLADCMGSDNKEQCQLAILVSCFLMWVLDRKFKTFIGLNMQAQFTRKCARLSQMNEARTFLTWSNKAEAPVHWTFAQCYHDMWMREKEKYQRYVKEASKEYALVTRMNCVPESIPKKPKGDKSTFYLYKNDDGKATVFLEKVILRNQ